MYKKRVVFTLANGHHAWRQPKTDIKKNNDNFRGEKFSYTEWHDWLNFIKQFLNNNKQTSELVPLFSSNKKDSRPFIDVEIFQKKFSALLDSGATQSVLGGSFINILKQLNLNLMKSSEYSIFTADGKPQEVVGCVDVPITADGFCYVIKFLVVPSVRHSIILGSDFCKTFGVTVDFRTAQWNANNKENNILALYGSSQPAASFLISLENLNLDEKVQIDAVKNAFAEISGGDRLGLTNLMKFNIETGNSNPFRERQYSFSPYVMKIINQELDKMLEWGVVEPSHSAWNSPVLLVKKGSGEYRFCFDGRALNKITKHDAYPLPRVDRILSMLRDAKYISSIDLRKAFWQIPLDKNSREKTAFSIPGRGLFHFNVVPFGLKNSAQCQQRLMDLVLSPKLEPKVFCYLDDIIITSSTFEEHISILYEVLARLKSANLTINLEKCQFFKNSLKYLGYVVDSLGLRTDSEKVSAMINFPRPTNTTEVKRFIGTASWYRRFINHFSTLVAPLNDLLKGRKKGQSIKWTLEAETSFLKLKEALISAPILRSADFTKRFIIQCDASATGLGGVLLQKTESGEEVVIAYASRSLSRTERNYTVSERECLAVIFGINKFRPYIEGTPFTIITDHYSLLWLNNMKEPTGRLARWAVQLQQFDYEIIHRKGKFNVVPDFLSRIPPTEEIDLLQTSVNQILDITLDDLDPYYLKMQKNIARNPNKFPNWRVKDGFVYKNISSKNSLQSNTTSWKLLVPKKHVKQILEKNHDSPTAGHFGFNKTLHRIQENYFWSAMRHDIHEYIKKCKLCASQKMSNNARVGLMGNEKVCNFPFQILALDLMGPFPRSTLGNTFLLVVADWFTKFTFLHPLRKAEARNICSYLEKEVFLKFGVPQFIICDNGTQFAGKMFKNLTDKYEVQKIWFNARYHPQCNYVERINRTIGVAIRSYLKDKHTGWDKNLPEIQYAINSAVHEATSFTPSFLVFGRLVPITGRYYGNVENTGNFCLLPRDRADYLENLKPLSEIFEKVKANLSKAYGRSAQTYNLRRRDVSFSIGEKVWKRNRVLSDAANQFSAKLAPRYVLCKVVEKISRLVYRLQHLDGSDAGKWHVQDLKPYFGSNSEISYG